MRGNKPKRKQIPERERASSFASSFSLLGFIHFHFYLQKAGKGCSCTLFSPPLICLLLPPPCPVPARPAVPEPRAVTCLRRPPGRPRPASCLGKEDQRRGVQWRRSRYAHLLIRTSVCVSVPCIFGLLTRRGRRGGPCPARPAPCRATLAPLPRDLGDLGAGRGRGWGACRGCCAYICHVKGKEGYGSR